MDERTPTAEEMYHDGYYALRDFMLNSGYMAPEVREPRRQQLLAGIAATDAALLALPIAPPPTDTELLALVREIAESDPMDYRFLCFFCGCDVAERDGTIPVSSARQEHDASCGWLRARQIVARLEGR